jgi:CHAD domain-containing protein
MKNKKGVESKVNVAADVSRLEISQRKFERTHVRCYEMEKARYIWVGISSHLRFILPIAMPFQFKKSESPAKGVQRVCRERIGAALGRLRKSRHPAAVHGVRKEIKKLRAIFRLVRGTIGRGTYRKGAKALREAADRLAATRDARVTLKAFENLAGRPSRRFGGIERLLRKNARREAGRFRKDDSRTRAKRLLRKTDRRVDALKIKAAGWGAIEPGLKESYRRGREARRLARKQPSPENFHDWRKHVKDLWHYFCLLHPAWPAEARAYTDELELLGGRLGEEHDLFLLQQFVSEHCAGEANEATALNQLIASRQKALRAAALKLGSRLYAETPAVICRRLENYWKAWRER